MGRISLNFFAKISGYPRNCRTIAKIYPEVNSAPYPPKSATPLKLTPHQAHIDPNQTHNSFNKPPMNTPIKHTTALTNHQLTHLIAINPNQLN